MKQPERSWEIFLLGGASGVGKTSLSYPLARHYGVALTEVDDFQVILEVMTTPEQQPALHFWNTHPAPHTLPAERIVEQLIAIGNTMLPALVAVICNHAETHTPLVLEGDFIQPSIVAHPKIAPLYQSGQLQATFVYEPDEQQILRNFLQREPAAGPQELRARVSYLYSEWLKEQAEQYMLPVFIARPWEDAFERLRNV